MNSQELEQHIQNIQTALSVAKPGSEEHAALERNLERALEIKDGSSKKNEDLEASPAPEGPRVIHLSPPQSARSSVANPTAVQNSRPITTLAQEPKVQVQKVNGAEQVNYYQAKNKSRYYFRRVWEFDAWQEGRRNEVAAYVMFRDLIEYVKAYQVLKCAALEFIDLKPAAPNWSAESLESMEQLWEWIKKEAFES